MRTINFKDSKFVTPDTKGYFIEINLLGEKTKIYWVRHLKEAESKLKSVEWFNAIHGKIVSHAVVYNDDNFERVAVYTPAKKEARWSLSYHDGRGQRHWQAFASLV